MRLPVLCLRPQPGLDETVEKAKALGLRVIGTPIFQIEPVPWTIPEQIDFDALLVGSANVFRQGGSQLDALKAIPVFAVGDRTTEEAEASGFAVERIGSGGLQNVIDACAGEPLRYLRLSGEDNVALRIPERQTAEQIVVYRSKPLKLNASSAAMLMSPAVVALHSAVAAEHFSRECNRLGVKRSSIMLATLGPRIAASAGDGWGGVFTAPEPNDIALLAMIANMCQ